MGQTAHPHLENALRDLRDRFGAEASALTANEMFDLVECVRRAESPFAEVNADAIGFPVKVCEGVYLWRLTAGASAWLDAYAGVWWGGERDGKRYFWALCYALANARSKEAFVGLDTPQKAQEAIRQFVLRVPATQKELALAVDKVLGRAADEDDPKSGVTPPKDNALDWASLVARLEGQSGIRADEWLWGRSAGYCVRAYNDLGAFADRYGAAAGNGEQRRMRDLLDEAMDALARCKARIGRRIRADRVRAAQARIEAAEAAATVTTAEADTPDGAGKEAAE